MNINIVNAYIDKLHLQYTSQQIAVLKNFYNKYISINNGNTINGRKFKYPYKPYLIILICKLMKNNQVDVNSDFLLKYKEYLVHDPIMVQKYPDIDEWSTLKIKSWLYKNPMNEHRTPFIFKFDLKNNKIYLDNAFLLDNDLKLLLMNLVNERLLVCTGADVEYDCQTEILKSYEKSEYILNTRYRPYGWRELVLQKSSYCQFCGIVVPLQAAHIIPHRKICNTNEYKKLDSDENNGLVLCANCHFIFDKYLLLKKENNEYRFYIRKNISQEIKTNLENKLEEYSQCVNSLVKKQPEYIYYFDELIKIQNNM